jgi:DNA-binding MurR/RpiR family transcriptional regulator
VEQIIARFQTDVARRTKAGRKLSDYFCRQLSQVPFETSASIAGQLGVSPMTVMRFLRQQGYTSLDGLKAELRLGPISSAWDIKEDMTGLQDDLREGRLLSDMLSQQMKALHSLNQLTHGAQWQPAVDLLVQAPSLFVAGYQNIGGIAHYFSEQMTYVRDKVRFMDGQNGTYLELLEQPGDGRALVLIDCRRFASKSRALGEAAREAGIAVLLVTDSHCDWTQVGSVTLSIPAMRWRTWDSFMPLAALLDLLVTSAAIARGERTVERSRLVTSLQSRFGDFER